MGLELVSEMLEILGRARDIFNDFGVDFDMLTCSVSRAEYRTESQVVRSTARRSQKPQQHDESVWSNWHVSAEHGGNHCGFAICENIIACGPIFLIGFLAKLVLFVYGATDARR